MKTFWAFATVYLFHIYNSVYTEAVRQLIRSRESQSRVVSKSYVPAPDWLHDVKQPIGAAGRIIDPTLDMTRFYKFPLQSVFLTGKFPHANSMICDEKVKTGTF